jgi:hypothetical protein
VDIAQKSLDFLLEKQKMGIFWTSRADFFAKFSKEIH